MTVLSAFANHAPKSIEAAKSFITENQEQARNIDSYRIAVHSLKGSTRSIGAKQLGDLAEKLENAAREQNLDFIKAHTASFIADAEKLTAGLTAFINSVPDSSSPEKPEKEAPDPEILNVLKEAAGNYDMAALQEGIEALDAYSYTSYPDLVRWLREKAGKSDFIAIEQYFN
jgi:HPt (histidine-containing phosphotransfer) domain-containing protein